MTILEALRRTTESIRSWAEGKFLNKKNIDSALSSTSENPVQNKVVNNAISNLNKLVGNQSVSSQIDDAVDDCITNLSVSGQTITYTKGDGTTGTITTQDTNTVYTHPSTSGYKHIPSGGSSGQILRWSADGTAVWGADNNNTYSNATTSAAGLMSAEDKNKLDGIAAGADSVAFSQSATSGNKVGTITINGATTDMYAPVQTTVSGNAGTADTLKTTRYIDGVSFNGSANVTRYATCSTAADVVAKTVTISAGTFNLITGARVTVKFTYANNVASPTLNVGDTGAKAIYCNGVAITSSQYWQAGSVLDFVYNGTQWDLVGIAKDNNTTYSVATQSANGLMSATDKTKLDGIASGADSVAFTQSLTSGTKVGTITINGAGTDLYAPTNTDTHYTSKNVVGSSTATSNTTSVLTNGNVYLNSVENGAVTSTHKISGSGATTVATDASGNIVVSSTNTTYSNATTSSAGLMSAEDKTALNNLGTLVGNTSVASQIDDAMDDAITGLSVSGKVITYTKGDGTTGTITTQDTNTTYGAMTGATASAAGTSGLVPAPEAGKNTSFLRGDGTWSVPAGTTYNNATTSTAGLMSATDKTKLDGIANGANAYVHPTYTAKTGVPTADQKPGFGGTFTVTQPASDATGHITSMTSRTITIPNTTATTSADGLMSSSDKTALNTLNTLVGSKSVATQITDAISSGAVSWGSVTNKPFSNGDIIVEWDGNTSGKTYVSASGDLYYKVSDTIFRPCDFTNDNAHLAVVDASLSTPITEQIPLSNVTEEDGVLVIGSYNIISTPYNSMEMFINNKFVTFPTAGTYFRYIPDAFYISSLTVTKTSGKIVSKTLPQGVASKADLLKHSNDSAWRQIYNSGSTTKNVNAFSNIDISGYTKIKVAIKCVNVTASAGTTAGAVIFTGENGVDYSFSSLFGNLVTNTAGTAGAMAEFTVVDGFIICDNALRSTSAANMLSNTEGQGAWGLTNVGGGLITCDTPLYTMKIATTNLSTTHYYGTGSKVIVWGCKA